MPRRRLVAQESEFHRQVVAACFDECVHAARIRVEVKPVALGRLLNRALCRAAHLQIALPLVVIEQVCRGFTPDQRRADHLRQFAGRVPAREIHLE